MDITTLEIETVATLIKHSEYINMFQANFFEDPNARNIVQNIKENGYYDKTRIENVDPEFLNNVERFKDSSLYKENLISAYNTLIERYKEKSIKQLTNDYTNGLMQQNELLQELKKLQECELIDTSLAKIEPTDLQDAYTRNIPTISFDGFPYLSQKIQAREDDTITIGARTGSGKTMFALNLAVSLSSQGWNVLYFDYEVGYETMMQRLAAIVSHRQHTINDVGIDKKTGQPKVPKDKQKRVMEFFNNHNFYLFTSGKRDENGKLINERPKDLEDLKNKIVLHLSNTAKNVVIVDYNRMIHVPKIFNENERLTKISNDFRQMCTNYRFLGIMLSQVTKNADQKDGNEGLSYGDLYGASAISADSTTVLMLYPDTSSLGREFTKKTPPNKKALTLRIAKNRYNPNYDIPIVMDASYGILEEAVDQYGKRNIR